MINVTVPVDITIRGRDGRCRVWVRPMTAREQMRYDRDLRRAVQAEEDASTQMLELYIATLVVHIVRVDVEGEDFAPYPPAGRDAWIDGLGIEAITTMVEVCVQRMEDDRLGKSTSGRPSPLPAECSVTDAPMKSAPSGDAGRSSLTPSSARSGTLLSRLARWIWKWLTGTGTPSKTASYSKTGL